MSWSVHSAHLKQPSGELDDPGRDWVRLLSSPAAIYFLFPSQTLTVPTSSSLLFSWPIPLDCHPSFENRLARGWCRGGEGGLKENGKCTLTSPDTLTTQRVKRCYGVSDRGRGSTNHTIVFPLHQIISALAACRLGISTIFLCDLRREQTQPVGGQSIYFLLISLLRLVEAWGAWSLIH